MRLKDLVHVQIFGSVRDRREHHPDLAVASTHRSPAIGAGLWNRPTSILVEWDATVKHLPIVDRIRRSQLRLVGLSVVVIPRVSFVQLA